MFVIHKKHLVSLLVLVFLFIGIAFVQAWTGPASAPPNSNVDAPVNVGAVDQIKDAALGLNGLAIFGNAIISTTNGYLNFGDTAGESGYGLRDNAGNIEFKNDGGNWGAFGGGGGAALTAIRSGNSSITWTKPSGLAYVIVELWGGGGSGGSCGTSGSGGTTSFGSFISASGGTQGNTTRSGNSPAYPGVAGGIGSGGDINLQGQAGAEGSTSDAPGGYAASGGSGGSAPRGGGGGFAPCGAGSAYGGGGGGKNGNTNGYGASGGGAGGYAMKLLNATDLAAVSSVSVIVGSAGGSGSGAGGAGGYAIYEYTQ